MNYPFTLDNLYAAMCKSEDKNRCKIIINNEFLLSVVYGRFFYSSPRIDVDNPKEYTAVEVALLFHCNGELFHCNGEKISGLINPRNVAGIKHRDWIKFFENDDNSVASYVPVEQVVEMVNDIAVRNNSL